MNLIIGGILELANKFGSGVFDVVGGLFGWLVGQAASFLVFLSSALPSNPLDLSGFVDNIVNWETGLSWLNWWLPIGQIATLLGAWVLATLAYYTARIALHFIGKLHEINPTS